MTLRLNKVSNVIGNILRLDQGFQHYGERFRELQIQLYSPSRPPKSRKSRFVHRTNVERKQFSWNSHRRSQIKVSFYRAWFEYMSFVVFLSLVLILLGSSICDSFFVHEIGSICKFGRHIQALFIGLRPLTKEIIRTYVCILKCVGNSMLFWFFSNICMTNQRHLHKTIILPQKHANLAKSACCWCRNRMLIWLFKNMHDKSTVPA